MSDTGGSDFDPRFDPAFQPGFDPGRHPAERRVRSGSASASGSTSASGSAPDERSASAAQRIVPPPSELPEPISVPDHADQAVVDDDDVASSRPEPMLVALWIVSAVFVAAGIYGLRLIGDRVSSLTSSGGFGGADYYLLQAYTFGAPMLIVLGLATATGTLFLLAARRLRRQH